MPIIRPQAGSRVQCYRIPDDWPVLTLNGADGRPVILTVNALGPAEALAFARRMARGVALWTAEVRECYAEGESGWERRARTAGAVPNLLSAELVERTDPPWRLPTVEHTPPKSAAEWGAERDPLSPWCASETAAEWQGWWPNQPGQVNGGTAR